MTITRKRIINPQRYLYALHHGDKFYIAGPLESDDYPRLASYGSLGGAMELAGKAVCVISGNWFHLLNLRSLSKIKFSIPRFL